MQHVGPSFDCKEHERWGSTSVGGAEAAHTPEESYTMGGLPRKLRTVFNDHVTGRHVLLSLDARQRVLRRDCTGVGSRVP